MKRLSYLLIGMLAVLFLSGGCYVTFHPCMSDGDQTELVIADAMFRDSWNDVRIIEQAMTAVIWGDMTHCSYSFVSQLSVDTDGDGIGDAPQGTTTYSLLNLGWNQDSSDIFPSSWDSCNATWRSCCRVWNSIFHPCNHFGHPTQFDGAWQTTGVPSCDHGGVRSNWVRTSLGYRPGECRAGIMFQHYGLSVQDMVDLMEKGTRVKLGGEEAIAFEWSAENTEITLSQGGVSKTLDLGDYSNTFYVLLDNMTIRMLIDGNDVSALPIFTSYGEFLSQAEAGAFNATITYNGITGTYPYAGLDTKKDLLKSVNLQIEHLQGIASSFGGAPIDGSTRGGRLF